MPPRVEYCVTDLGITLKPTLDSLANWMTQYRDQLIGKEIFENEQNSK